MSTDLSLEEFRALYGERVGCKPYRPGPITDPAAIADLIAVAGVLLDGLPHRTAFSFETLVKEIRELLEEGQTIGGVDIWRVLHSPKAYGVGKAGHGLYRWLP